ncbi:MAG TPA: HAMP domain-containing protein [Anaerolineae bacterium]|nr:HAMP domain-containing protein [Anaerolineae bacterium]
MFKSIRTKLVVAFLLVVLVPLIGTALYGNWITSQAISQRAVESARHNVRMHAEQFAGFLNQVRGDVLYISRMDSLQNLIEARAAHDEEAINYWRTQVMRDFLIFSAARPMYYQVRYLDETGQEVVRIDSDGRVSHIIRPADLQNKRQRYYFQETMTLPPGGIYVSSLDLNREQGEVERPYKPVIRYATPLFDDEGGRRGIVIINVYADHFLSLLEGSGSSGAALIMANQDGYYMAHPDSGRLWGGPNDLNTGRNVREDYPQNAAAILSGQEGDFSAQSRVVVYTPLYPVRADRNHFWVIMSDMPATSLFEAVTEFRVTAVTILIIAIVVAFIMAILFSNELTAPILQLREGVERFSQGELDKPVVVKTDDEIGQLTGAFNQMAAAINQHLEKLDRLNTAGQQISSGLDRQTTVGAILQAAKDLFHPEYCAIICGAAAEMTADELPSPEAWDGDENLACSRQSRRGRETALQALREGQWTAVHLPEKDIYYCCAPLCLGEDKQGIIELAGRDPFLTEPATGNLLFTLAVEASIALENVELYEALAGSKAQLEQLVEQLIDAQEAERKFVAYDLHDGLIQYLVAARLQLSKLYGVYEEEPPDSKTMVALNEAMSHLTQAVQEGRRVIEGLRPTLLDSLGLASALGELARDVGRVSGWQVEFDNEIGDARLPATVELTAFRIAQEALTNARKHAHAGRVTLKLTKENGDLCVAVTDDGMGFDKEQTHSQGQCIGLISMRERAVLLGGDFWVESEAGRGTAVVTRLPLTENAQDDQ